MPTAKEAKHPTCAVVIVTHNSEKYIPHAMASLQSQTRKPDYIIIVDSASKDPSYLNAYAKHRHTHVEFAKTNLGFCRGNNVGYSLVPAECTYVLFLNPDAFLIPTFIEEAITFMEKKAHKKCAVMTGALLGFDVDLQQPTGVFDSTGIFSTWYGRWYDRDQGVLCTLRDYRKVEEVPAICGALMFCRKTALDSVKINEDEVFDNSFYMYKEDIDLSYRLKKAGWHLTLVPQLTAYHCRGWQKNRSKVPKRLRMLSAKNELRMHVRQKAPIKVLYSFLKLTAVSCFNV